MAKATSSANTTGNSATSREHRLFDILLRYKPPPWRGSYSLSRLFLSFYLLIMGSFVGIAYVADLVISTSVKGITDDYTRRFMQGTVMLIEEELFRQPRKDWPQAIKGIGQIFSYRLDIVERWSLKLNPKQAEKLDAGELAIDKDGDILYHRLKHTSQVLVVGPISPNASDQHPRALPWEVRLRLLTWSLIGLILAIAVWFWVRPIWRDLETLRQTARDLGEGHLEARAPEAKSPAFKLLTETMNGMAERIQRLIAVQKELSSAISHELRTPIARMRFVTEMLTDADSPDERRRLQTMMNDDLEELDSLVDSSLVYSRFERELPEPHLTRVDFEAWLNEKVDAIRILGRSLELHVDCAALPPGQLVELDQKSMPYALTNLLRNAIKYTKSRIVVSAEVKGNHIFVHVDDDGLGIAKADRQRVFKAFARLDRSRDRATGGHGLGLAIVRLILEQHGGTAVAEASPLGGARFTLSWPLLHDVTQT